MTKEKNNNMKKDTESNIKSNTKRNTKRNTKSNTKRNNKANIMFITALLALLISLFVIYLYISYYYKTHFLINTEVNGVETSNMTTNAAEEMINNQVKDYTLTIHGRNGLTDTITGQEINLHTTYDESLADLIDVQNTLSWPSSVFIPNDIEVNTMLEFDESLLGHRMKDLVFLGEENNVGPKNASISKYGENGYEIIPENSGAKILTDKLKTEVLNAIISLETTLDLEEVKCYAEPEITYDNDQLKITVDEMNRIAGSKITYEFGDNVEILDGSRISEWLSIDSNFNVDLNVEGIKQYVDYIGKTYNSFGRTRDFKTSYGKDIQVKGGDYGWWLNRPAEVEELIPLIRSGEQLTKTPVYFQTAQQYGKDDIGTTYVEVNLTAQHLYFYVEGELILDTDFVSGNVSKGLGTPTGTYPVQYKDNDATLVGEDYATPVKYWMPFNKNIGFHDAPWRTELGKDIYLTNGSHGCINMPPKMAKKMFQYIKRGVAVVVYELSGTENYEVKEDTETQEN